MADQETMLDDLVHPFYLVLIPQVLRFNGEFDAVFLFVGLLKHSGSKENMVQ